MGEVFSSRVPLGEPDTDVTELIPHLLRRLPDNYDHGRIARAVSCG
jgi:hypothetical protein